jgi:hypothetical protein
VLKNDSKTLDKHGFDCLIRQMAESKKSSYEAVHGQIQNAHGPSTAGTTVSQIFCL